MSVKSEKAVSDKFTDAILNKMTKSICLFLMLIVFGILSVVFIKAMDGTNSNNFIIGLLRIPNSVAVSTIDFIKNELQINNIFLTENFWNVASVFFRAYWITSTLVSYCVLSYFIGLGLVQFAIKIIISVIFSPLIMPIVIMVAIVSFIKNAISLAIN